MSETPKDKDQEKGDEVLRRLLKTPPDPKKGKAQGLGHNQPRKAGKNGKSKLGKD
jgi:hypothetical protein